MPTTKQVNKKTTPAVKKSTAKKSTTKRTPKVNLAAKAKESKPVQPRLTVKSLTKLLADTKTYNKDLRTYTKDLRTYNQDLKASLNTVETSLKTQTILTEKKADLLNSISILVRDVFPKGQKVGIWFVIRNYRRIIKMAQDILDLFV